MDEDDYLDEGDKFFLLSRRKSIGYKAVCAQCGQSGLVCCGQFVKEKEARIEYCTDCCRHPWMEEE